MVVVDENFKNAGKKTGIEIWRIKFHVLPLKPEEFGTFYEGDSYIVLSTKKPNSEWDVHFWLGAKTTQDEYGTAAMKTVELDEFLGGGPVQYREVQGHESELFLSYFKHGIKYLQGGYETGFKKVGAGGHLLEFPTRLFHVKGKKFVRVRQVELSCSSLNQGDVFILDCGRNIFVWMPPESGKMERIKATDVAKNIRDSERSGKAQIIKLENDWNDASNGFFEKIGGKTTIKSAKEGGVDDDHFKKERDSISAWRITEDKGKTQFAHLATSMLSHEMLVSGDAYIIDALSGGIFVWLGKGSSDVEKKRAMEFAQSYIKEKKRPSWTPVVRILEGNEPEIFLQWFAKRPAGSQTKPRIFQLSDKTGTLTWEEYRDFEQDDLEWDDVTTVDAGDTIYLWLGGGATPNEIAHSTSVAKEFMTRDIMPRPPGGAKLVIMKQGEETEAFKKLFPKWDQRKVTPTSGGVRPPSIKRATRV